VRIFPIPVGKTWNRDREKETKCEREREERYKVK
jgi:hypothetical protein